jgi:periplasmic mercuric ion binding protein
MKNYSLLLAAFLFIACAKPDAKEAAQAPSNDPSITLASVSVPHTQCEMCEERINEAVTAVAGVTSVKANAATDSTQVSFDKTRTNLASIEQAISKVGYAANGTARDSAGYANLPSCCQENGH